MISIKRGIDPVFCAMVGATWMVIWDGEEELLVSLVALDIRYTTATGVDDVIETIWLEL